MTKAKALLIIDMQKGSFTSKTPRYNAEGVIKCINQTANLIRGLGHPVVFIQHDGLGCGEFEKHTWEWEILDELEVFDSDIKVDKYANDVFYRSQLSAILQDRGIEELFITGCATDFCVESTIQSALIKDFNITVVADGHTTGDRPHIKAEQVITHYNWVWENMLPTQGKVTVCSLAQLKKQLLANDHH